MNAVLKRESASRQVMGRHLTLCLIVLVVWSTLGQSGTPRNWVYRESRFVVGPDVTLVVQNSLPKGGGVYTDTSGKKYSYVVFWTRVINRSRSRFELFMQYPREPFYIFPTPESFIRIFLPPEAMTAEKVQLYDYGLSDWRSYLDLAFHRPSTLHKIIEPGKEVYFYTQVLFRQAFGATRAELVLDGENLRLMISIAPDVKSVAIPCGKLIRVN